MVIGFNEPLQLLTTSNYNVLDNSPTPVLTTALVKFSIFTSRCLITGLNSMHCSAPVFVTLLAADYLAIPGGRNEVTADHQSLVVKQHLGPNTKFFTVRQRRYFFFHVGHPLQLEGGSVVYNCCRPSPALIFTAVKVSSAYHVYLKFDMSAF